MSERNETTMKRLVLDRPEERDLRVLATATGIDRLARGHALSPYESMVALKLALASIVKGNRAPMASIHQFRGFLLDIEAEMAAAAAGAGDEEKGRQGEEGAA